MTRSSRNAPDLLSGLDSSAAAHNNARVVRDAQRADPVGEPVEVAGDWHAVVRPRLAFLGVLLMLWSATARL